MKMLTMTEETEPLKWRFYHASHTPDLANTNLDLNVSLDGSLQVEDLSVGDQMNGDLDMMHSTGLMDYDFSPGRASPRGPVKAIHDLSLMFPDTDSGFGSYKSRGRQLDDFSPTLSRLPRSRSLTRLNGLTTQEMSEVLQEKPVRHIQTQLEDSEARRNVLMHKLKEAQATLELQNDRLAKIENAAKDNSVLVDDLKFKEREYRKKIAQLQCAEEEKQMLQLENGRLREEMQDRIDTLDFQLKTLKNQHMSTEDENDRRVNLLDQTTVALSLLEQENTKLQMDRDKLREEIHVMKEAFQLSKSRYDSVETESKSHKAETEKLREENLGLNKRVHEMAGQMMELRNLLQAVKDDNDRLSTSWKSASEDKNRASKQMEGYQDTMTDLKSRLAAAVADKDRLFQERLDLNHKVQSMILEKEQLLKSQMVLEEQVEEQQKALEKTQYSTSHFDSHRKHLEDELCAVKRVSEDLSSELSSVKAFYERSLEQLSLSENGKKIQEQQLQLAEQERKRLQGEVDRLNQVVDGRHRDDREERQHLEDTILKMRSEMKDLKYDKEQLSKKCQEFETKLRKANEEIRGGLGKQHEDLETWKTTCDRLTSSVTRKETELENLSEKCRSLEGQLSQVQEDLRHSRDNEEISSEMKEELQRLRDENRCLLQEKAENEQMLQLLETQRDVLTKSTESSLNKLQDVEQLSGKVDQMRNENELLRQRISELEKVRDNLIIQKEELLASSELIYKSQGLEELEGKMGELRDANKQLRDINEVMSNKLQIVEQENLRLKQSIGDMSTKEEVKRLREENQRVVGESNKLRKDNQEYKLRSSKDIEASSKELQKMRKERDALQKQVQLINGQLNLLEGSKKRSDETAQRTQDEVAQLRSQLDATRKECAEAKRVAGQVKSLSEQLKQAKKQQESQEKLIRSMKEELEEERSKKPARIQESLEDVGAELQHMSGQLHKLMSEIENKEQTIESLEGELRTAKDTTEAKEHMVTDLKKLVSDLEQQNTLLKANIDSKQAASSWDERPSLIIKEGEKSLKEELEEAVKTKQPHVAQPRTRSLVRYRSMIPIKRGTGFQARLTFKQEEERLKEEEEEARNKANSAGEKEKPVSVGQPAASVPSYPQSSMSTVPASESKPLPLQPPLLVLSPPPEDEEADKDRASSVLSPEGYPRSSTPYQPGKPLKDLNFGSAIAGSSAGAGKASSVQASANQNRDVTSSGDNKAVKDNPKQGVRQADLLSPKFKPSGKTNRTDSMQNKNSAGFPPVTPSHVDQTKPRLSFSKPQPAAKAKARKLPQIRVTTADQAASAASAKRTETELGKAARNVARVDSARYHPQTTAPRVPVPTAKIAAKPKTSPRESRNQFITRKELTGKPSKLLSDSGVTVIATKTGSLQNSSTDIKYVVKKQDPSVDKKDQGNVSMDTSSTSQSSSLKSFEDLLSSDSKAETSQSSSGFSSGSIESSQSSHAKLKSSSKTETTSEADKKQPVTKAKSESAYSKLKDYSVGKFPTWAANLLSEPSRELETPAEPISPRLNKSSSVRDFLDSFSSPRDREMQKDKQPKSQVKPSFSRFSASKAPLSITKNDPSVGEAFSPSEPTKSLEESVLPKDDKEREKLAELILSLASEPSLGSSLSSTDSWSLLLEETAGERTLSYEKLEQLANKAKASKAKESADGTKVKSSSETSKIQRHSSGGDRQDKPGMVRSASTSSLSAGGQSMGSIMKQSLEDGQPLKFKPATGLFLSKSLGHPISAVPSQSAGGASGDAGNVNVHRGRYGAMYIRKPDKPSSDSGDRLQSLISKYRSHSSDPMTRPMSPVDGAQARGSSAPPSARLGLGSPRGRGFTSGIPKAPLLRSDSSASEDSSALKQGKKLPPPPPPPKPGKSLMKSLSSEEEGKPEGAGNSGEMLDSQEQSDINALIQKPARGTPPTKSLLSVHPPKLTSTSKFLKCRREQKK